MNRRPLDWAGLATWLLIAAGCGSSGGPGATSVPDGPPGFTRQVPWAGTGQWIRVDAHIHTNFSDGAHAPSEVVQKSLDA